MSLWKPALVGALLGPLAFALFGGAWWLATYSWSVLSIFFGLLRLPFYGGLIVPAGIAVLIHALLARSISRATCQTSAVLLAAGISMLAWNAATIPLRFGRSLKTTPAALGETAGNPEKLPTGWIFIGATATGAVWGIAGGLRTWRRQSAPRRGNLTPDMALSVAVVCGAFAVGLHVVFFHGPLYGQLFTP